MPRRNNKLEVLKPPEKERAIRIIADGISSDIKNYQSWQSSYMDPNPVVQSAKFAAEGGYKVFEAMSTADSRIFNAMTARKDALKLRPYHIMSPIPGDERQDFKTLFVAHVLDHIPYLAAKKKEIGSDKDYGYSVTEKIFARKDVVIPDKTVIRKGKTITIKGGTVQNALIVTDLRTKPCTAFDFDLAGNMRMAKPSADLSAQMASYTLSGQFEYLTDEELQHFMVSTHDPRNGSRKGTPLMAPIFWDYIIKKTTKIYRAIFAERFSMPFPHATYNNTVTDTTEIANFEARVKAIQKSGYIVTPEGFAISFIESINKTSSMDVYQNILDYIDGNYSEVILGDRKAAEAPADKEGKLRQEKLEADAVDLDALFNDDLIKQLVDFNFVYDGYYPYQVTNVRTAAAVDKILFQAQTFHNIGGDLSDSQLRELTGFRPPDDDLDTIAGVKGQLAGEQQASGNNMKNQQIADGMKQTKSKDPAEQFEPEKEQTQGDA